MKSWTRTLNFDDAHTLLAVTRPGVPLDEWMLGCRPHLDHLSADRQREVLRLLRDGFLELESGRIRDGLFLRFYSEAPASAQLDLVHVQWALTHPISLIVVNELVSPALDQGEHEIGLSEVEDVVRSYLETRSAESIRKTRTVLLNALDGVGALITRGTGQHRSIQASRGLPHPLAFGYLVARDLGERSAEGMMRTEAVESSLPVRLTQCTREHAERCLDWNLETGVLAARDDEIVLG